MRGHHHGRHPHTWEAESAVLDGVPARLRRHRPPRAHHSPHRVLLEDPHPHHSGRRGVRRPRVAVASAKYVALSHRGRHHTHNGRGRRP